MKFRWEFGLIAVCAIWGATFTVVQDAVERTPPFLFLGLRFSLAAVVLGAFGAFRGLRRFEVRAGLLLGVVLFAGYALQTVGLQYTSPSNAGFITGLFVVFTPSLGAIVARRLPPGAIIAGVVLATGGLVLLAMPRHFRLGRGDALVLGCAIAFAIHIVLTGALARGTSALRLTAVQVATTAVLAGTWSVLSERATPTLDRATVFAIALTGIGATAIAFVVQTRAQQHMAPERTAIILSAEPVFAGLFGYLVAGDRLGARGYTGAGLIFGGILAVEAFGRRREEERV